MTQPYNREKIDAAIVGFHGTDLSPAERLMAAAQLLQTSIESFRKDAPQFRTDMGDEITHAFARQELNDLIYELQDAIQPLIKTYNSLLRDPSQKHEGPPAD